jgi:four helix bundle protein
VRGTVDLTRHFPVGHVELKDQLVRSALATMRHIAEGASRVAAADRRQRYIVARGECAECDASLEAAELVGASAASVIISARELTQRIGAMLTRLIEAEAQRLPNAPRWRRGEPRT